MRTMYDAVTASRCPRDGDIFAGYVDGRWPSYDDMVRLFPGKVHVTIAVFASTVGAQVYDVEQGDLMPAQVPDVLRRERAAGRNPTMYVNLSNWHDCVIAVHDAGLTPPPYWVAHYTHQAHLEVGSVATQWESTDAYDISQVADFWPGIDKEPTMIWPFGTRDDGPNPGQDGSGQWRHIDQGQDLQAAVGTPLVAVASGTIVYAHDPQGFGDPYPVLHLDTPIDGNPAVYFGHNHPTVAEGTHVEQGGVISYASNQPGGNAAGMPGWLEIGWWSNGPTGDGQSMHDHLLATLPPAPPAPLPPSQNYPGDHMTRHPLTIATDPDGNGYADLPVAFTKVVSLFSNGADPQTGGHYTPIPRLSASQEGQGTRVELEGGPPGGQVLVFVTEAA